MRFQISSDRYSVMKRLLSRLYYFVEMSFQKGARYQLLVVALVIVAISVAGGTVVFELSPQFSDLSSSIWWAFLRLTDPGYLGDDQGTLPRVVSTILTVSGYVVFLGALVAIMTNTLGRFMDGLAQGRSKIFERQHILIIGWHARIHAIVEELIRSEERVVTRLGRARLPAIVVLAKEYRSEMATELRAKLPPDIRREARLLVRSGNPLEAESLERVDFARASSIILVSQADLDTPRHFSDMTLVKILMSLRAQSEDVPPDDLPNVVLDIAVPANKVLAESVGWRRTEAIANVEFMSRLLCQTIRHPGISEVYLHLLTDMYGESLYLVRAERLGVAGQTIREIIHCLGTAIPIGFMKASDSPYTKEGRLRLMALDEPMDANDELVCVAPSLRSIRRGFDPNRVAELPTELAATSSVVQIGEDTPPGPTRPQKLLVVGWSYLVRPLLAELGSYHKWNFEVTVVSERKSREVQADLSTLVGRLDNLTVSAVRSGLNTVDEVRQVEAEDFDDIVLLSPEFIRDPLLADAETVMAFVLVDRYLNEVAPDGNVEFVAELNDEDNQPLLQLSRPADILITREIVSHLLSQVSVRRALAWVYEELFTYGGSEISFRAFDEIIAGDDSAAVDFYTCQEACARSGRVAIGYRFSGPRASFEAGVHVNPDRDVVVQPEPGDQLIVVEG